MTVLVKTESSVKKLVWVPDGDINRRPPAVGGGSSSYQRRSGGGGQRSRRPSNGGDDDFYIEIVTDAEGNHIIISITGPVVVG